MPRRKKRNNKKSLSFEESPKNVVRNLPSPVFGADHPTTADVVALDGSVNIPWVSPDSNLVRCPLTVRRCRTRRHTGISTNNPNATAVTPTHNKHRINSKIKPLKFIGDVTAAEASTAEDISVDELLSDEADSLTSASFHRAGKQLRILSESSRRLRRTTDTPETSREWSPVLKTRTAKIGRTKRKMNKNRGGAGKHPNLGELFSSDSEVSLIEKPETKKGHEEGNDLLERTANASCDTSFVFDKDIGRESEVPFNKRQAASPELTSGSVNDENDYSKATSKENTSFQSTQHRPVRTDRRKNGRRLFSDNLNRVEHTLNDCSTTETHAENYTKHNRRKSIQNHSTGEHGSHFSSCTPPFQRRRSLRLRHLLLPRDSPLRSPQQSTTSRVLVYDTPEEDYDLPVRQRRLRNWGKRRNESLRVALYR